MKYPRTARGARAIALSAEALETKRVRPVGFDDAAEAEEGLARVAGDALMTDGAMSDRAMGRADL